MLIPRYLAAVVSDIFARVRHGLGFRRSRLRPVSMIRLRPLALSR